MEYVSHDSSCLHRNKTHIHTDVNAYVYSPIHVKTKLLQDPNTSITKGIVGAPKKQRHPNHGLLLLIQYMPLFHLCFTSLIIIKLVRLNLTTKKTNEIHVYPQNPTIRLRKMDEHGPIIDVLWRLRLNMVIFNSYQHVKLPEARQGIVSSYISILSHYNHIISALYTHT